MFEDPLSNSVNMALESVFPTPRSDLGSGLEISVEEKRLVSLREKLFFKLKIVFRI